MSEAGNRIVAAALALMSLAVWAEPAAAMDCSRARTASEKAVCASPDLMAADRGLNDAYRAALAAAAPDQRIALRTAQRDWVKNNDGACHGDAACLGLRYKDRITALAAAVPAAAPVSGGAIRYKTVTVAKTKPYDITLSYPKFEGSPAERVAALNAAIELPNCDVDGEDNTDSEVTGTFTVKMLNGEVAVIHRQVAVSCSFAAHPSEVDADTFLSVASGKAVDLYDELPDQAKTMIFGHFATEKKALKADDDCADALGDDPTALAVAAGLGTDGRITFTPDFPHVSQACDDSFHVTFALDELRKLYPAHSAALAILDGLAK